VDKLLSQPIGASWARQLLALTLYWVWWNFLPSYAGTWPGPLLKLQLTECRERHKPILAYVRAHYHPRHRGRKRF